MKVEVCFLIGTDGMLLWADQSASPYALPDSRARWEAIWRHRDHLAEIAHTHPAGTAAFSAEDESTMAAIDAALGRHLTYAVVTATAMVRRLPCGSDERTAPEDEPWWAGPLRAESGIREGARS
ncbi:Mov34/MPN/PAD-1 family protein [Spirillospora sp. NPDC047279]|uniref:Mov34/MPN/PAD-1 family protein n=1 Tax=Spirillospora sp. NPDC047279 TaxID=3155478 RepID=UPI0033CCDD43